MQTKDRSKDRHKTPWHTQVRDVPPEVWARIRAGATSRYVMDNGRSRHLNVGEYITRCVLLAEAVRDAAEESDDEAEFYKRITEVMEELGLEAVRA